MEKTLSPVGVRWETGEGLSLAARLTAWLRRLAAPRAAGDAPLLLEARLGLGPKKSLVLVNCCGKLLLLAVKSQAAVPGLNLGANNAVPWTIVFTLTLLTLLPAIVLSMTPMVRLLVVFHFLRQALGTQTAPSNQVLMGLGLMMTWFLMQPVLLQVDQQALTPYRDGTITGEQALERGMQPVKQYMLRYAREKDLALFVSAGMAV